MSDTTDSPLPMWAIVEIMGKQRIAGRVREEPLFGIIMVRVDIPVDEVTQVTQYIHPNALFRITPCAEVDVLRLAPRLEYSPLTPWEIAHWIKADQTPPIVTTADWAAMEAGPMVEAMQTPYIYGSGNSPALSGGLVNANPTAPTPDGHEGEF